MDGEFHPAQYDESDYLTKYIFKLIHASKRIPIIGQNNESGIVCSKWWFRENFVWTWYKVIVIT